MNKFSPKANCPYNGKEAAIRNLGGMKWLYEKHLSIFQSKYADSPKYIAELLCSGRKNDARIMVHSIKGLAGTLGFRNLYYASSELEKSIAESSPRVTDCLINFSVQLNRAVHNAYND